MIIHKSKWIEVRVCKSGRGESFHWKPLQVPHRRSMAEMEYWKNETYKATFSFVTTYLQIFWLWFVIGIEIKQELLSSGKYTRYESTHFASIDEVLKDESGNR